MKKESEQEKTILKKNGLAEKTSETSSCCGPTCCGGSDNNKLNDRKEK